MHINKANIDHNWFVEHEESSGSIFGLNTTTKLHEEQTPFQKLQIFESKGYGRFMVLDDCMMLTQKDNFLYHEMMSHPILYTHPNPKKVVIIGGGDCGVLKEVLKHPNVKEAWQIEIDERVTRVSEQYFPELCTANKDPRANFYFDDGIAWLKNTEAGSLDVIIVDSTDPIGPATGLFQASFYQSCFEALGDDGMLVHQSDCPLLNLDNIIKPMRIEMTKAGFSQLHTLTFPQPTYPGGWWSCTIASKKIDPTKFRLKDARNKDFETRYYNAEIHQGALATPEFMRG